MPLFTETKILHFNRENTQKYVRLILNTAAQSFPKHVPKHSNLSLRTLYSNQPKYRFLVGFYGDEPPSYRKRISFETNEMSLSGSRAQSY